MAFLINYIRRTASTIDESLEVQESEPIVLGNYLAPMLLAFKQFDSSGYVGATQNWPRRPLGSDTFAQYGRKTVSNSKMKKTIPSVETSPLWENVYSLSAEIALTGRYIDALSLSHGRITKHRSNCGNRDRRS